MGEAGSNTREGRKTKLLRTLRGYGNFIESKFKKARQFDIDAYYIQNILSDVTDLVNRYPEENSSTTKAIKDLCASAISLYYEPNNRPYFFNQIESIGALLRQL